MTLEETLRQARPHVERRLEALEALQAGRATPDPELAAMIEERRACLEEISEILSPRG